MSKSVLTVFDKLSETFSAQDIVRDALRTAREAADGPVRTAQRALSSLHTADDLQAQAKKLCELLEATGKPLKAIEKALPDEPGAFYRYIDLWHQQLQTTAMVAVVLEFVKNGSLANVDKVKEMIAADVHLPIEDYLIGVCNAVQELARLSLNRVIRNDFQTPRNCHQFATNIFDGFKELNLRNDFLRKRYDGMKYDVKKMEDILYDLSIRGLLNCKKRKSPQKPSQELTNPKKVKTDGETKTAGDTKTADDTKTAGDTKTAEDTKTAGDTKATIDGESKAAAKTESNGETNTDRKTGVDGEPTEGKDSKESPMDTTTE